MILQNKIEAIVHKNELVWKNIFGLITKEVLQEKDIEIVTIRDYQSDEMSPGMSSP